MSVKLPNYGAPQTPDSGPTRPKGKEPLPEGIDKSDQVKQEEAAKEAQKKEEAKKPETESKKEAAKAENKDSLTKTRTQDKQRSAGERSSFKQDSGDSQQYSRLPQKMGHKATTTPELARQREQPELKSDRQPQPQRPSGEKQTQFIREQRPMPKSPSQQDYKNLLNEKFFRQGPLKETPLHKEFQRQAIKQNVQNQMIRQQAEKPLTKAELSQLVRLRHQSEQKKSLRNILRHEIAKARQQRMSKMVLSVKSQTDAKHGQQALRRADLTHAELSKQQYAQKLDQSAQSKFERILQQVLAGNKKSGQPLPDGVRARFLAKTNSEWNQFFKNMANMNSAEVKSQGKLSGMIEALFRGLFAKEGSTQQMLVADLAMAEGGEVAENKFSQLLMNDPKLLAMFQKLKPGDVIPHELLQKLGEKFEFIKMANLLQLAVLTDTEKNEILKMFKQQHSPEMQKKLEQSLLGKREEDRKKENDAKNPVVYPFPVSEKPNRVKGTPRIFMYMLFGIAGVTLAMIVYMLFRHVF